MKTIRSLVLLSLAMPLGLCLAQQPNPYLNQPAQKAPEGPSGDSFLTLVEHVLVPSDLLDSWLAGHSMTKDANELRAAAQQWIQEGKATIDSSALTAGTVGRKYSNESLVEQIYATEYEPAPSPDAWTVATSFETRNCGYEVEGDAVREQGELVVRAKPYFVRMLPHRAFDAVSEQTRQPDDIFIPRFRSIGISQSLSASPQPYTEDPFASDSGPRRAATIPSYPAGKIHLVLRVDDDLPEPVIKRPEGDKPENEAAAPLPADRLVRLIFVRGDKTDSSPESVEPLPADYQVSVKLVSVDHPTLSGWLQGRDLTAASRELGESLEVWNEDDKVTLISSVTGGVRNGTKTLLENIKKLDYPTEYEPGRRQPTADGKSTQLGFATPGEDVETRNLGTTLETEISTDAGGPLMLLSLDRVLLGGYNVHHRTLRDGEWIADMTMPRVSSNRWNTSIRVKKGEWMFVGSGSGFDEKGQLDPSRAVIAFVKVD